MLMVGYDDFLGLFNIDSIGLSTIILSMIL